MVFILFLTAISFFFFYQWPGSYCDTQNSCCYPTTGKPAADFGIHGLWPNYKDGSYPSNCDPNNRFQQSQVLPTTPIARTFDFIFMALHAAISCFQAYYYLLIYKYRWSSSEYFRSTNKYYPCCKDYFFIIFNFSPYCHAQAQL